MISSLSICIYDHDKTQHTGKQGPRTLDDPRGPKTLENLFRLEGNTLLNKMMKESNNGILENKSFIVQDIY